MDAKLEQLVSLLRRDNYCLMTDDEGVELYDEKRNLLVYNPENTQCLSIPNVEVLRNLYSIPPDNMSIQTEETSCERMDFTPAATDEEPAVWLGQRSERCLQATKALIRVFDSPRYQELMNDKSTIKLKVWEKIACELQNQGFKIAKTDKEAGLRTFQKWRNMERTYWRYLKNPAAFGEDKRRKKPSFFDDMHVVLSKRNKQLTPKANDYSSDNSLPEADLSTVESQIHKEVMLEPNGVEETLLNLINSEKYEELFRGGGRKTRIWENVCDDLESTNFFVPGNNKREKSQWLFHKWKSIKRSFLKYQSDKEMGKATKKPFCYDLLLKINSKQIKNESESSKEPKIIEDQSSYLQVDHDYSITHKPMAVEEAAENVYQSLQSLQQTSSVCVTDMYATPETSSIIPPLATVKPSSPVTMLPTTVSVPLGNPVCPVQPTFKKSLLPKDVDNHSPVDGSLNPSDILLEIKTLHETNLALQQQNFARIISLLEEQNQLQRTLNTLFTQYTTNISKKRKSKHRHKISELDFDEDNERSEIIKKDCYNYS